MTVRMRTVKHAVTHFNVLERFKDFTFIECQLETGRTHQIRVHMKYIGYLLAGDPKYGPKKTLDLGGQALHAGLLGFVHPRTMSILNLKHHFLPILKSFLKNCVIRIFFTLRD